MDEAWERAAAAALKAAAAAADAKSLNLDGAVKAPGGRLPSPSLFEDNPKLRSLEHLSISNVRLASLDGFPRLPALRSLVLSDNRIAGGLQALVDAGLAALQDLDLSNNRIASLDDLAPLAKLRLVSLDLYECPVTKLAGYREKVFGSLKYLDNVDAKGNERLDSDEEEEDEDEGEEDEEGEGDEEEEGEEGDEEDEGEDDEGEDDEVDGEEEEEDDAEEEDTAAGNAEPKTDGENDHVQKNCIDSSAAQPGKRKRNGGDDV